MNYYQTLKPQAEETAGVFHRAVTELKKQVAALGKNLANERNLSERLEAHIKRLKKEAGRSLGQGKNTFEKFRVDFTKRGRDLETSKELVIALEQALSQKQGELATAETNLRITLNTYVLKCRPIADQQIDDLLRQCLSVRQDFLDALTQLYSDYGLVLVVSDETYCPGRWWNSLEVKEMRRKLKMDGELPDYDAIKLAAQASIAKPPTMPEIAPAKGQDEQGTPDPAQIPSEAPSELAEAEPPLNEALGEAVDVVLPPKETLQAIDEALATTSKTLLTGKVDRLRG